MPIAITIVAITLGTIPCTAKMMHPTQMQQMAIQNKGLLNGGKHSFFTIDRNDRKANPYDHYKEWQTMLV